MASFGYEDVRGLDVAMNDAFRVRCIKRIGNFDRNGKQLLWFQRPSGDADALRSARPETPWR